MPKGRVVSQDPEPGEFLPAGDEVDVLISTGQPDVVMPDVLGDDKDDAKDELEELGLKVKLVEAESDADADVVIDSDPRPATSISVGTRVTVVYSDGPEEVPSVVGLMQSRATSKLENAGFNVNVDFDSETRAERGTVLSQTPEAFSTQPEGTTVTIVVSDYVEPTPTESPTDADRDAHGDPDGDAYRDPRPRRRRRPRRENQGAFSVSPSPSP